MFYGDAGRSRSGGRWQGVIASGDSYVTRVMCGLVVSLALLVGTVHLPLDRGSDTVGWYVSRPDERLHVEHLRSASEVPIESPLPTAFENRPAASDESSLPPDVRRHDPSTSGHASANDAPRRLAGRKVLDYAHSMPAIVGGIGAYYIHIEYPEAAIREGIEGRLVLSFVVGTDGETSEIRIVQSLHPACDSAAVRALRKTRFIPGSRDGEPVEVKMRLPVRFQLVTTDAEARAELKG